MATNFSGLNATNNRLALLQADFSGMKNLDKIIDKTLKRLSMESRVQGNLALYKSGAMSREEFDGFFAELVRKELGKTLGIVRNKAIAKARQAGAGSAASAVLRRMYKSGKEGNINTFKRIGFTFVNSKFFTAEHQFFTLGTTAG